MKIPSIEKILTERNIILFYLFLFNVQIYIIEGKSISILKNIAMGVAPLILLLCSRHISKAMVLGTIFFLTEYLSSIFHPATFRVSTLVYSGMFIIMYIMFYNLLHKGSLKIDTFLKFVRFFIFAYIICHLCQQVCLLIGIRNFPLINLTGQFYLQIDKLPSLHIEPSTFARTLGVLMYAFLKCNEIITGEAFTLADFKKKENRWLGIGFLWSMLTMGSGTAMIVIVILLLYFVQWKYLAVIIPTFFCLIIITPLLHIQQLDRVILVAESAITGDADNVRETDNSAAARITPIINTFNKLNIWAWDTWFGKGIDSGVSNKSERMLDGIDDYGLLFYIASLALVFNCCIKFFSIPTVMFFIGVGGGTNNIAYLWGLLLIFTCVRYFTTHNNKNNKYHEQIN